VCNQVVADTFVCVCVCVAQLSHIVYANGEHRDVMKTPKSSAAKTSLPGQLFVGRAGPGASPVVYPRGDPACKGLEAVMHVVYNKRPVPGVFEDFSSVQARLNREWAAVVIFLCLLSTTCCAAVCLLFVCLAFASLPVCPSLRCVCASSFMPHAIRRVRMSVCDLGVAMPRVSNVTCPCQRACMCVQPANGNPISSQLQIKINDVLRSRGWKVD